jgi:hypothetical protein
LIGVECLFIFISYCAFTKTKFMGITWGNPLISIEQTLPTG